MTHVMAKGANIPLTAAAVRAVLRWTAAPGAPEVDVSALLVAAGGKVRSDADFVFYNQPEHPSGAVRHRPGRPAGAARRSPTRSRSTSPGSPGTWTGWCWRVPPRADRSARYRGCGCWCSTRRSRGRLRSRSSPSPTATR
ncbi:hypothetical protein GCM10025734_30170 [Kitasatospora paranensis]